VIKGKKALNPYIEEGFALIDIVFKTSFIKKIQDPIVQSKSPPICP